MKKIAPPRDAATVVLLRDGAEGQEGRAYISLPGDPRHPLPDVLGGSIRRSQLETGRYRAVGAGARIK